MPMMLFNFGVALWMFRVGQDGQRAVAPARGRTFTEMPRPTTAGRSRRCHARPRVEGRWPVVFKPRDPTMWVEKRVGSGDTLNMGNPRAWLLRAGMMLAPMIAARRSF